MAEDGSLMAASRRLLILANTTNSNNSTGDLLAAGAVESEKLNITMHNINILHIYY